MLTIFSIPKPFKDPHIINIQTNAIKSWAKLGPEVEVFLAGDDFGVAEFCQENNIHHIKDVKCNEFGTPLLDSTFELVRQKSKNQILMYINADIILTSDILPIFPFLPAKDFLVVGQRWDLDVPNLINFSDKNWEEKINDEIKKRGALHPPAGSDYFIFPKDSFKNIPSFAVGRIGWDNWMIEEALAQGLKVIDVSPLAKIIHQNHDHRHKGDAGFKVEDPKNLAFLNKNGILFTLKNANYSMTVAGLEKTGNFIHDFIPKNLIIIKSMLKFLKKP